MSEIVRTREDIAPAAAAVFTPIGGSTKRLIDIALAVAGIALLLPLLTLCFVGTLLTSRGSVIFRHRRVGFQGRHFDCLKFRTMAADADSRLREHLGANQQADREWAETRKLRHDPRVTPFGAILRKASLDELPQLFNVLKGDMSIVGPRPVTDDEIERYGHRASDYLACRPGITGLWQVNGRSRTSYSERVMFDCTYATNWSLKMDAKIVLSTLPAVIGAADAY